MRTSFLIGNFKIGNDVMYTSSVVDIEKKKTYWTKKMQCQNDTTVVRGTYSYKCIVYNI